MLYDKRKPSLKDKIIAQAEAEAKAREEEVKSEEEVKPKVAKVKKSGK